MPLEDLTQYAPGQTARINDPLRTDELASGRASHAWNK